MTFFGCSAPALAGEAGPDAITRVAKTFAPTMVRLYLESGNSPVLDARCTAALRAGASLALSFKNWDDTRVRAFVDSLPKDRQTIVTYFHEPEDNVEGGSLSLDDWRARTIKLCQIIKDAGRVGQVRPAVILMAWTLNPTSKRNVADFATPEVTKALVDAQGIWGWDDYLDGSNNFKADFTNLAKVSAGYGLPWGVFETGVALPATPDVKTLSAFWQKVFTYLGSGQVTPPVAFLYWNANTAAKSYAIDAYPPLLDVWKQAPALYAGDTSTDPTPDPTPTPTPTTYTQAQLDAAVASAVKTQKAADAAALTAALAAQQNTDAAAQSAAVAAQQSADNTALASALATAQATAAAAQAAAVAAQKAADDAALATSQANSAAALAAEQAHSAQQLADAQTAAVAHLSDLRGKADYILAKAQKDAGAVATTARASIKALIQ